MVRVVVVAAIPLGLAGLGAVLLSRGAEKAAARAVTEAAAASRGRWTIVAIGILVFVAHLTVDAARARIASRPDRRSALLAWFSGTWLVLRRPVHALAIGLAGAMVGPVLGLVVMGLRERLPAGPRWAVVAGVLLAQVAAVAVGWGRAVRIAGLTRLSRADAEERLSRRPAAPPSVTPGAGRRLGHPSRRARRAAPRKKPPAAATASASPAYGRARFHHGTTFSRPSLER